MYASAAKDLTPSMHGYLEANFPEPNQNAVCKIIRVRWNVSLRGGSIVDDNKYIFGIGYDYQFVLFCSKSQQFCCILAINDQLSLTLQLRQHASYFRVQAENEGLCGVHIVPHHWSQLLDALFLLVSIILQGNGTAVCRQWCRWIRP